MKPILKNYLDHIKDELSSLSVQIDTHSALIAETEGELRKYTRRLKGLESKRATLQAEVKALKSYGSGRGE